MLIALLSHLNRMRRMAEQFGSQFGGAGGRGGSGSGSDGDNNNNGNMYS